MGVGEPRGAGAGGRGGADASGADRGRFLSGVDLDAPPSDSEGEDDSDPEGQVVVKGSPLLVRPPAGRMADPALFADGDSQGDDGGRRVKRGGSDMETSADEEEEEDDDMGTGSNRRGRTGMGGILKSASMLAEKLTAGDGDGDAPMPIEWERVMDPKRARVEQRGFFLARGEEVGDLQVSGAWGAAAGLLGVVAAGTVAEDVKEALGGGAVALFCAGSRSRPAFLTRWLWRLAVGPCAVEDDVAAQGAARAVEAMAGRARGLPAADHRRGDVWRAGFASDVCGALEAMGYCGAAESVPVEDAETSGGLPGMPEGEAAVGMSVLKEWKGRGSFRGQLTGYEAVAYPNRPGVVAMEYTCVYEDGDAEDLSPRAAQAGVDLFRAASVRAQAAGEAAAAAGTWTRPLARLLALLPGLAAAGLLPQAEVEACLPRLARLFVDPVFGRLAGMQRDAARAIASLVACLSDAAWDDACLRLATHLARGMTAEPSRAFHVLNALPTSTRRERALQRLAAMLLLSSLNESPAYIRGGGHKERFAALALAAPQPAARGGLTPSLPLLPGVAEVTAQIRRLNDHVLGRGTAAGADGGRTSLGGSASGEVNFWSLRTCVLLADMALGEPYSLVDGGRGGGGEADAGALEDMVRLCLAAKKLGKCIRRGMRKSANMAKVAVDLLVAGKYEYVKDAMAHGFGTLTPRKELDPFAELSDEEDARTAAASSAGGADCDDLGV